MPRRRPVGLPFGDLPSRRRGHGSDIIGTRPYEIGDPVSTIDWFASARLSAATGRDEFIVRDHAADEAPRVALVCDRRPAMGIYAPPLPWLSKPRALIEATATHRRERRRGARRRRVARLRRRRAVLAAAGTPRRAVARRRAAERRRSTRPRTTSRRHSRFLGRLRSDLPTGSFVFVLSDFLVPPPPDAWLDATGHGWDVVPVVIQDPAWEQSFPDVGSVVVPIADPRSGRVALVRLTRREVEERRAANEARLRGLLDELTSLGLEPVLLGTSDPHEIDRAFVEWAEARRQTRWAR